MAQPDESLEAPSWRGLVEDVFEDGELHQGSD